MTSWIQRGTTTGAGGRRRRLCPRCGSWCSKSSSRRGGCGSSGTRSSLCWSFAHRAVAPEYGPCPTPPRASSSSATSSAGWVAGRSSRCCPSCARAPRAGLRRGQRRERRRRPGDHAEDRRRAARRRRRRHHAGQPRLPSQGDLPVPGRRGSFVRPTSCAASRAAADLRSSATAYTGSGQPCSGNLHLRAGRPAFVEIDPALERLDGEVDHARRHCMPRPRARRSAWAGSSTAA